MRISLLITVLLLMNGCSWVAWRGYEEPSKTPPPSDYVSVKGECFSVGLQNLNEHQRIAILEASAVVCEVIRSKPFEARVKSQDWLASCDLNTKGEADTFEGEKVYELLSQGIPNFSVNPKTPWMAIAQAQKSETNHSLNRVAIKPSRIESWYSSKKGDLINTIAHESTHLISYSFRDKGHGTSGCPDSSLVSYGVGDLAEELSGF